MNDQTKSSKIEREIPIPADQAASSGLVRWLAIIFGLLQLVWLGWLAFVASKVLSL